jgi:ubiquitin-like protein Pup
MAMSEFAPQRQSNSEDGDDFTVNENDLPQGGAKKPELDNEVDSLLDEIDDVLETNAEEFVRSFVQKGGQ